MLHKIFEKYLEFNRKLYYETRKRRKKILKIMITILNFIDNLIKFTVLVYVFALTCCWFINVYIDIRKPIFIIVFLDILIVYGSILKNRYLEFTKKEDKKNISDIRVEGCL